MLAVFVFVLFSSGFAQATGYREWDYAATAAIVICLSLYAPTFGRHRLPAYHEPISAWGRPMHAVGAAGTMLVLYLGDRPFTACGCGVLALMYFRALRLGMAR
jgi:hypothetical protein